MPHIYRLRAKEKSLDQPAVERYSKSPKALVRVGDGKDGDPCKPLGLPLEIMPLTDPFRSKVGDTLKVRVLFGGSRSPTPTSVGTTPVTGKTPPVRCAPTRRARR